MKIIEDSEWGVPIVELTRRNLTVLLAKLDDPLSVRTILDGEGKVAVRAVEDKAHYANREPGKMVLPSSGQEL